MFVYQLLIIEFLHVGVENAQVLILSGLHGVVGNLLNFIAIWFLRRDQNVVSVSLFGRFVAYYLVHL